MGDKYDTETVIVFPILFQDLEQIDAAPTRLRTLEEKPSSTRNSYKSVPQEDPEPPPSQPPQPQQPPPQLKKEQPPQLSQPPQSQQQQPPPQPQQVQSEPQVGILDYCINKNLIFSFFSRLLCVRLIESCCSAVLFHF